MEENLHHLEPFSDCNSWEVLGCRISSLCESEGLRSAVGGHLGSFGVMCLSTCKGAVCMHMYVNVWG